MILATRRLIPQKQLNLKNIHTLKRAMAKNILMYGQELELYGRRYKKKSKNLRKLIKLEEADRFKCLKLFN